MRLFSPFFSFASSIVTAVEMFLEGLIVHEKLHACEVVKESG